MWCRGWLVVVGTAALSVGLVAPVSAIPATPAIASASSVAVGSVPGAFPGVEVTPVSSPGVAEIAVGSGPVGVAFSADGGTAVVSNMFAGTVSRVRTTDGVVTATVPVGRSPQGVALSGDGSFAYVVNRDSNTVSRIRMSDATVTSTIPLGSTPFGVAMSPDGSFAYVTNVNSNTVTRIRTSDDAVTATIPVGTNPYPVAMSPDGSFAYVGNFGANTVSRIRTSDGVVTATIPVGSGPVGIAFAPDSSYAMVTNQTGGTVSRIRTSDGVVTATIPVGTTPVAVAISPDSATALVTNYASASVSRIATASNTVAATFAVGIRPYGVAYAPSGEFAYVANFYFDNVWRIEAPQRPGVPTALAGPQKATVTVTPPAGGSAPTSYRVTSTPEARTCTVTAPALSCDVSGLTADRSYTFTATATNGAGTSALSLPSTAVTPLPPPPPATAPTITSVTPGDRTAQVTFQAPVNAGGVPVTGYEYSVTDGDSWARPTPAVLKSPLTIAGLVNGTVYWVKVRAVTVAGPGVASTAVTVTPRTVPGIPGTVKGGAGDRWVTVSWTAPTSDGGSPVTGYTVTAAPGGATCTTSVALSCDVRGLTNGTAYTFTVTATNAAGNSAPSTASAAVTPVAEADPPSPITATIPFGDGDRTGALGMGVSPDGSFAYVIKWLSNAEHSKSTYTLERVRLSDNTVQASMPIVGEYLVMDGPVLSPDGSFAYLPVSEGMNSRRAGLLRIGTSGNTIESYTYLGEGVYSLAFSPDGSYVYVAAEVRENDLAVPRLLRVRTADGTVAASGKLAFGLETGRDVHITPDGRTVYVRINNPARLVPIRASDLAVGLGIALDPQSHRGSTAQRFAVSPDGRFILAVYSWVAVPGRPDSYQVARVDTVTNAVTRRTDLPGNWNFWQSALAISPDGTTAYLAASRFGVLSTSTLSLENDVDTDGFGPLPGNVSALAFVRGAPAAYVLNRQNLFRIEWPTSPAAPSAEATNAGVRVTVPSSGLATSYRVVSSPGATTCTATAPSTTCLITGLTPGQRYTFAATARNAAGSSPPSPPSAAVTAIPTPAGAPTIASVTATNGSVQLQVTPPTYTSGLPIIAYEYSSDDGRTWHRPSSDPAATTITVTGLTNGTAYRMRVRAVNDVGPGDASAPMTATPRAIPDAPVIATVARGGGHVTVAWSQPASDGGSPVLSYRVTSSPGTAVCTTTELSCKVTGLTDRVPYTFQVTATNVAGTSAPSAPSAAVAPTTGKVVNWPNAAWDNRFPYSWVDVSDISASPWNANYGIALARGAALFGGSGKCALTSVADNCAPAELRTGVTAVKAGWDIGRGVPRYVAVKNGQLYDWSVNIDGGNIWRNEYPETIWSAHVTAIAIGYGRRGVSYSMAIDGGEVVTWGPTRMPVPAEARSGVTAIAAGSDRAAALKGGKVIAWNHSGRFVMPTEWESGVSAIAASDQGFLAIKGGRVLFSEGMYPSPSIRAQVQSGVSAISMGPDHWLALKDNGTVVAADMNGAGAAQTQVPARYQGRFIAVDAADNHSLGLVAPAPPRPATLAALPPNQTAPWNANLRVGARYTLPEDTKVTKSMVVVVQASNRKFVGSGPSVPLGRGRYLVTQKIWYMMSNLATGFAQSTQVVSVAKEPPPAPPPPPPPPGPTPAPTYDYLFANGPAPYSPYSAIGIGFSALPTSVNFGAPTWIAVKEQGARVRVFVSNPQRFLGLFGRNWVWVDVPRCFAGTVDNGNASYSNGSVTYSNGARESASAYLGYNKVVLYGLGGRAFGNAMGWQGNGSAPGPTGAATLRRQVDSCG